MQQMTDLNVSLVPLEIVDDEAQKEKRMKSQGKNKIRKEMEEKRSEWNEK